MKRLGRLALLFLLTLLSACGGGSSSGGDFPAAAQTRSFKMGFTPWLYEASLTAQSFIYDRIQTDGEIISHHIMDGVPWQEALDGAAYPQDLEDEISGRLNNTGAGTEVYLSIASLNGVRDALVDNWGAGGAEPRSGDWATRSFDDPEVIDAYVNFALDLIDRFQPTYFNYGVEVSGLLENAPAEWDNFVVFAEAVYDRIKTRYPDLEMMVSLSLKSPGGSEMQTLESRFAELAPYVDVIGVSIYPYAFFDHADKGDPANMPDDWLSQINVLAPGKPIAITETGWAAEDLVIANYGIDIPIDETDQRDYADILLQESEDLNAEFVIWWTYADFDALWAIFPDDAKDVGAIWRDTGLLDESLNERPAIQSWRAWFERDHAP